MEVSEDEAAALLVLIKRADGSWGAITRRVRQAGSALRVADEAGLTAGDLFDPGTSWDADVGAAKDALHRWAADDIRLVTCLHKEYPTGLADMSQPPPILFCRGAASVADSNGVAIVGSRRANEVALQAAFDFAAALASAGVVVISGLAAGVDTAAHSGALATGGRTVAVIGTGIARYYPAANRALQDQIAATGQVVSQFWPESPPTKISFPMRNEVMSAWGRATCVMQADARSGARMQARVALQQGRQLYLHDLLRHEQWAIDYVKDDRARFVTSASELLEGFS